MLDPGGERAACDIGEPGAVVPHGVEACGGGERHARTGASAPDGPPRRSVRPVLGTTLAPLTLGRAFTAWRAEPGVLVAVVALGGGYGWGLRRRTVGATGPWPAGRTAVFLAGVATILLVGCSFLGVYDDAYFWVRAVQNTVLLMVTPMLLALGAPIRLAADTLPARLRTPLARALHSRVARTLTFPLVVTVVLGSCRCWCCTCRRSTCSRWRARSRPASPVPSWPSPGSSTTGRGSASTPPRAATPTWSRCGSRSWR